MDENARRHERGAKATRRHRSNDVSSSFSFSFLFFLTLDESLFSSRVLSNSDLSSLYYVSLEPVSDIVSRSGLCLE